MGVASVVGGLLISRDAQGLVQNYWMAALVGIAASLLSMVVAGRLIVSGLPEPEACRAAIVDALTDDPDTAAALDEVVQAVITE